VLSDLHDPKGLPALKRLNQEHDVVAIQMIDPAEDGLKGSGFIRGQEAESGRTFVSHGRKQWLGREHVAQELKRAGVDHLVIETDKPIAHRVRYFFESRNILTRGAR
jgi:hypothetical protein